MGCWSSSLGLAMLDGASTVHSGQSAVNESVNELLSSPGINASHDNNEGTDSGQQTTESCQARGLLISGFGVRVPGGAPVFIGQITLSDKQTLIFVHE